MRVSDIECGTVTVTGPRVHIIEGFTSDGVIDIWGSSVSSVGSGRIPVSSTTDEGLGEDVVQEMYVDDAVWVDEESGWYADVESVNLESSSGSEEIVHGVGPSIAFTQEQCSDPSEEDPGHGREPSIAESDTWPDHSVGPDIASSCEQGSYSVNTLEGFCHGCEPSIACTVGERESYHGVEPSIAFPQEQRCPAIENLLYESVSMENSLGNVRSTPETEQGTRVVPCGRNWDGGVQVPVQVRPGLVYVGEDSTTVLDGEDIAVERWWEEAEGDREVVGTVGEDLAQSDVSSAEVDSAGTSLNCYDK